MSAITSALPELTLDGAERLSARISARLDGIADNYVAVMPLIREALNRNAHAVLGYVSPGAYIKDRFGDALGKLGIDLRREVVRELSNAGMSTRAIAPVVGVNNATVHRDLAGVADATPAPLSDEPGTITKLTGLNSAAEAISDVPDLSVNSLTGEVYEAGDAVHGSPEAPVTVTETHTVKIVTGLDGKEYPIRPAVERRTSIVDAARTAGWELRKAVERLERITTDDRYQKNKAEILAALQPHLDFANEVISDL